MEIVAFLAGLIMVVQAVDIERKLVGDLKAKLQPEVNVLYSVTVLGAVSIRCSGSTLVLLSVAVLCCCVQELSAQK